MKLWIFLRGFYRKIVSKITWIFFKKSIIKIIETQFPIDVNLIDAQTNKDDFAKISGLEIEQTSDPIIFENIMMSHSKWKKVGQYLDRQLAETDGWQMPGTEKSHVWCGMWQTLGCLNEKQHKSHSKKIFLRQYQRSCFRSVCRVCYKKWAARQAAAAIKRLGKYQESTDKVARLVRLCVPNYSDDSRKTAIEILKLSGCEGGAFVFSPFEQIEDRWIFNPAFYAIVFGKPKLSVIKDRFPGWQFEQIDEFIQEDKDYVFQTFFDLMLRSGVKKGYHSFVWFGTLSYRALTKYLIQYCKVLTPKLIKKGNNCPSCGQKLRLLYHDGTTKTIPPDLHYAGFVNYKGWCLVNERHKPFQNITWLDRGIGKLINLSLIAKLIS